VGGYWYFFHGDTMKAIYIFTLILICTACVKTIYVDHNNTIYQNNVTKIILNNTIIKEIASKCPDTGKIQLVNVSVPDRACKNDLSNCNINLQKMYRNYENCLRQNNSKQISNLTFLLAKKTKQYNNCSSILGNITKFMKR
jgi:hypothetical protein